MTKEQFLNLFNFKFQQDKQQDRAPSQKRPGGLSQSQGPGVREPLFQGLKNRAAGTPQGLGAPPCPWLPPSEGCPLPTPATCQAPQPLPTGGFLLGLPPPGPEPAASQESPRAPCPSTGRPWVPTRPGTPTPQHPQGTEALAATRRPIPTPSAGQWPRPVCPRVPRFLHLPKA